MLYWTTRILALAMAALLAPLFIDIAVALVGNLRRPRRWPAAAACPVCLAVVVPAHNEEPCVARTVHSLIAAGCLPSALAAPPGVLVPRVFVVAHNCTDATAQLAAEAGAIVGEIHDLSLQGKGAALRFGFQQAAACGANAFLVVDADSVATPNLIAAVTDALAAGVEALQCRYELELPASTPAFSRDRLRALAFRGINVLRARGRAGMGLSAGIFGNGFALTAAALDRVPFAADSICEDMEYHGKLVAAGISVQWIEDAGVWTEVSPSGAVQAQQEARWEGGRLRVAVLSTPSLLAAAWRGNLRALGALFEFWSLPTARAVLGLLLAALLPVFWLRAFIAVYVLLLVLYVVQAARLGQDPGRDLAALCLAPLHILWKVAMIPMVLLHTRRHTPWARTGREVPRP
jgi:cellulose synthase/poly-beta-1,6-N-acetylglucosamine synthase-like glycosyltransferase